MSADGLRCCLCGEPIDLRDVMSGKSDWHTLVNKETGDALHYHPACANEFDVTVAPVLLDMDGAKLGALAVGYNDENTARISFGALRTANQAGTLRVELKADSRGIYSLTFAVSEVQHIGIPEMAPITVGAIRDSLTRNHSYLIVGGQMTGDGFTIFFENDDPLVIGQDQIVIDGEVVKG